MKGLVVTKWHTSPNRDGYTLVASLGARPEGARPEVREQPGAGQRCDICGAALGEVAVTLHGSPLASSGGFLVAVHQHCASGMARAIMGVVKGGVEEVKDER